MKTFKALTVGIVLAMGLMPALANAGPIDCWSIGGPFYGVCGLLPIV